MISDFGKVKIGDKEINRIGVGGGVFFNSFTWGCQDIKESQLVIETAIDAGIEFIDTGETYGKGVSETTIGSAIKGKRDKVFIASKISNETLASNCLKKYEDACDKSLSRLGVEYLDLYQVHWLNSNIDIDTTIEGLLSLKKKGKIKNVGISNCGKQYSALFPDDFITNQIPYSILWRGMEFEFGINLEKCNRTKLFYYCLGQGILGTKYRTIENFPNSRKRSRLYNYKILNAKHKESGHEEALALFLEQFHKLCKDFDVLENQVAISWILQRTTNSLALVGLRNQIQVNEMCKLSKISEEFEKELTRISDRLKEAIGYKLDLWDSEERIK